MRRSFQTVVLLAGLLATTVSPLAAGAQSKSWDFSLATGVGAREVDSEGYGVPYVAFWAAKETSAQRELVYEGFMLAPTTIRRGPEPSWFAPELGVAGTSTYSVDDITFGAFVRGNFYLRDGAVRPYATVGGGVVFQRRVREWVRTSWALPDGPPTTKVEREAEELFGINSVVGFGVKVRVADRWYLRPEARIPIPFLPMLGHPASSIALAVGVTYSLRGR